jgi:transposase
MSTSLLYHAWGLRGYDYSSTEYREGVVIFHIHHKPEALVCSVCGADDLILRGTVEREFRALPIGGKPVRLRLPVQRVECRRCGTLRQANLGFAESRFSYTRAFERYALDLLRCATIRDVARHLDLSWDVIKDIQKRHLRRHYGKPKLKKLRRIAIDEIAIGRGHRYLTVVLDLDSGAVVFVGDGKGADALRPFWARLKRSGAKIQAVAIDMSPAYIAAVTENLPWAALVFDRFHVMKLYNEKLSDLRREMQREATSKLKMRALKGTRWLLLKNAETLEEERRRRRLSERERLERALSLNAPLACAYYMKEDLRELWEQGTKKKAEAFLQDWIDRARTSGIRMLQQFAKTLVGHRTGLLAWYDHPISTGPLEGTNTKIRVMQRQSYGLRDPEFQKLKIYAIHEAKYALVG